MYFLLSNIRRLWDGFLAGHLSWYLWAIVLTAGIFLCIPRNHRRNAVFAAAGIGLALYTWVYVKTAYDAYTPAGSSLAAKKKWLH